MPLWNLNRSVTKGHVAWQGRAVASSTGESAWTRSKQVAYIACNKLK